MPPVGVPLLLPPLFTNAGSSQASLTAPGRGHTAAAVAPPLDQHDREDEDNEQCAAAPDGDADDGASGQHRA